VYCFGAVVSGQNSPLAKVKGIKCFQALSTAVFSQEQNPSYITQAPAARGELPVLKFTIKQLPAQSTEFVCRPSDLALGAHTQLEHQATQHTKSLAERKSWNSETEIRDGL